VGVDGVAFVETFASSLLGAQPDIGGSMKRGKPSRPTATMFTAGAAVVGLLLTACSGSSGKSAATSGSNAAAGTTSASSGGSTDVSATISLSMQQTDVKTGDPTTWALVQAFEKKYPKIKVKVTGQPVAQHDQSIDVAAQSHTLPTIFWLQGASTGVKLAKAGDLLDLTPILQRAGITGKIAPATLAEFKTGNIQFGVPYQALVTGFYYNKKILADNGLQLPKTFDQLLHVATVLHAKGITTIADGANQSAYSVWAFLTCLDRFGYDAKINGILSGSTSYDNADFLRFYQDLAKLQKAGAFSSNVATQTYNQAVSSFGSGKAAFLDSGVWAASQLQSSSVGAHVGFWVGPTFTDGVGSQNVAMNVVGAPLAVSGSVKPGSSTYTAVEKFIDFYYSDAGQQIFIANGQPPVTTLKPTVPAAQTVFKAVLDAIHGVPTPRAQPDLYLSTASQNALYDSIFGVIEGQLSPQSATKMVQKAIKANK
jgi:raffinose/stachyose/melibiose transport system substrate-binding protein